MKKLLSFTAVILCILLFSVFAFAEDPICTSAGDADNDNSITAADARLILRAAVGLENFDEKQKLKTDLDDDGKLTSSDARLALRIAVGLDDKPTHKETKSLPVEATCSQTGLTDGSYCLLCETVIVPQKTIKMKEHTPVYDPGKDATCTTPGLTDGSHCDVCGKILSSNDVIPAFGHTPEIVKGKTPGCTNTGLSQGEICSVCNEILKVQEIIPAKGHSPVPIEEKEATCLDDGSKGGTICTVCNTVITPSEILPKLEHETVIDKKEKPATCISTGLTARKHCTRCGTVFLPEIIPMHYSTLKITDEGSPATCTIDGMSFSGECTDCGKIFTPKKMLATGHTVLSDRCIVCEELTGRNDYEILSGTSYSFSAVLTDTGGEKTELNITRKGDNMYTKSIIAEAQIGLLHLNSKLYMLTADRQYSLELTPEVRKAMRLSDADYAAMNDLSNSAVPVTDLKNADATEKVERSGKIYTSFYFYNSDGSKTTVTLLNTKLTDIVYYDKNEKETSRTEFKSVKMYADSSLFTLPSNQTHRYNTVSGMLLFMAKLNISL